MTHPAIARRAEEALNATCRLPERERLIELSARLGISTDEAKRLVEIDDLGTEIANLDTTDGNAVRSVLDRLLGIIR